MGYWRVGHNYKLCFWSLHHVSQIHCRHGLLDRKSVQVHRYRRYLGVYYRSWWLSELGRQRGSRASSYISFGHRKYQQSYAIPGDAQRKGVLGAATKRRWLDPNNPSDQLNSDSHNLSRPSSRMDSNRLRQSCPA